ncbi:MAG: aminopeptidase [Tyzzerella sp.]|nr:aminopeptidase [Tyzzerella sp.]
MGKKNLWTVYSDEQLQELEQLNSGYKTYLDNGKTERECIREAVKMVKEAGYRDLKDVIANGETLKVGDCVYAVCMEKTIALFQIGEEALENGMNILGAHVDSPRIDLKQNPLYENSEFAYLDTHYYGGIKKYQWVTTPLAIHGIVVRKDGSVENIVIGEDDNDPIMMITDILVHLAGEQMQLTAAKVIEGEKLDLLVGNKPLKDEEKDAVKANILALLKEKYNIEEDDFISAELEIVPAGKARDCGLDRSMIAAYGQDDRVCAYTSLIAMLEVKNVKRTTCCLLVDKEEIGSVGATGMQSRFFENVVAEILYAMGECSDIKVRRTLANSKMLSSDVSAAFDPMFEGCFEKKNSAFFGKGIALNKYTGSRGKGGSNDANPEYIAHLRDIMAKNDVQFQTAELGRVDVGGGGTIAYILANYGMEVIDSGVPVLNMHAPWEITSKADVYEAYRGYKAFLVEA